MPKKSFAAAPKPKALTPESIDRYVQGGAGHDTTAPPSQKSQGPLKRLSVDLPEETHRRFKTACAATGRRMGAELTDFIERRIGEMEAEHDKAETP